MCSGDDPGSFSSLMLSVRARTRVCAHACMHACVAYAAIRVPYPLDRYNIVFSRFHTACTTSVTAVHMERRHDRRRTNAVRRSVCEYAWWTPSHRCWLLATGARSEGVEFPG
jgi:hypothetical protein